MDIEMPSMKIGDAADEILGRPAFHYVKERVEVELTLVSAAELGVPPELPHGTSGGGLRVSLLARGSGRAARCNAPSPAFLGHISPTWICTKVTGRHSGFSSSNHRERRVQMTS
jgi:hypothetical protein